MAQDYNKTVNLPKTEFPMRAGLPKREPEILRKWQEEGLYRRLMEKNSGKPLFILHDGPPYANGDIHMGTAMNKTLKDFIVRYKNMSGFKAPYVPGWDTHGLPIESQILKKNKLRLEEMSTAEFRDKCKEFALGFVRTQGDEFKRLGVVGDWENPYLTLYPEFEAKQIEIFGEMAKRGYIYRGLKPVYWCPHDETALAEAEIEYADDKCESIYVKFKVRDDKGKLANLTDLDSTYFVIWTTTTWTLPGNLAISLNPDFEYVLMNVPGGETYIVASELAESVARAAKIENWKSLGRLKGSEFELMTASHPFYDRESVVLLGDHVTLEAGTGCVHTAPGHGMEDFVVCKTYDDKGLTKIGVVVPVDSKGLMTKESGKFAGLTYAKANDAILEELKQQGALLASETLVHPYPHCWRCKNPVIYRATEQWFASVDAIKDAAVEACRGVHWLPEWGEERMISMIRERSDWCVSRQRKWGVPIPIFYCGECGEAIINDETIKAVSALFAKEGSNAWFEKSASEILPEGYSCPHCGHKQFRKETDIMDVWFDSGSTHKAVLETRPELRYPADLYLEGGDQYRGWFQSSLLTSIATKNMAPYKNIITHGWVVDGEGKKMSKSLGNTVLPAEVMKEYGADILRLWVSSADFTVDVRISKEIFKQLSEIYLKIRNTARYILGNLDGFDPDSQVAPADMTELDRWALMRLNKVVAKVREGYESSQYHLIYHGIHNFCVVDMSNFYLDIIKDRLYCEAPDSHARRSAQTAMYRVLDALVRMLAPILAFTSEEIWQFMPHHRGADTESVLFNDMPSPDASLEFSPTLEDKWEKVRLLRLDVNKTLETARAQKSIGKALDARVVLYADAEDADTGAMLSAIKDVNLKEIFIVSGCRVAEGKCPDAEGVVVKGENYPGITVQVLPAEGEKCVRCWMHDTKVGSDHEHPQLCPRCAGVVAGLPPVES
ncbi:isoleucine--tRNA ligase [Papillibacter cinnamivorans]|uniref:Isoleucine--tRNA ligase n=1 Tax=Papillibacter cinnamivorans DSM 12816 TaxID=1122930 RepID=A0A1W2A6L6_9FIRM|nr:isoleucine--tRNA ligase [Papillibacter cinnamivorans]SMC55908.1 Isoleucyl-tRNA synthetase [Papillibacter cinnamivorans DSM 12816]